MHTDNRQSINGAALAVLIFSFAVLFSLALVRFIAQPQWGSFASNRTRLTDMKKALRGENGLKAIQTRLLTQQDSLAGAYEAISRDFGETKDLPGALRMLIEKANAADIQFVKMQPRPDGAGDAGSYPIVLEMTASYHSLGRFISSLEAIPHVIHVDRMAITANRNPMLDIRIQLTCYLSKNG
jgi:Tfp pilus assembly protein PilO